MNKKIVLCVKSCYNHRFQHQRIIETWGSVVEQLPWIELKFFMGRAPSPSAEEIAARGEIVQFEDYEVQLNVMDGYEYLTHKFNAILNWCASRNYTHIFTCDTDTYVDVLKLVRMFHEEYRNLDYVGYTGMNGITGAPHGGPGYWMSLATVLEVLRRASVENIERDPQHDEWWAFHLLQEAGIEPLHDDRYSLLTQPGSRHDCITYHHRMVRDDLGFLRKCHSFTEVGFATEVQLQLLLEKYISHPMDL